jgi:hypothetical protein
MLDFSPLRDQTLTMSELAADLGPDDLRRLSDEMVDTILRSIRDCEDADVVFVPADPEADDPYAVDVAERYMSWTLGHVIVHTTASAEESAALAAELARGVDYHGRSRSEVPWRTVITVAQCRQRLEESRRMRLASLDMWPDEPDLDNTYQSFSGEPINAVARFVWGLKHDDDHLGQIAATVQQARDARRTRA